MYLSSKMNIILIITYRVENIQKNSINIITYIMFNIFEHII